MVGFNETHQMVSSFSKKLPFYKNTVVHREKQRYSRVFSKKGSLFETLDLFKNTKVCAPHDPKIEQNILKNSVF